MSHLPATKRFGSPDSYGALASMRSLEDEKNSKINHVYSREFQAMLDRLDEEDYAEDTSTASEKKRRLSLEQVKALEKNFEVENKLEPDRKMKLAEELGLQPRQVAVWFQNRRARWKTKQLEKDYVILKAKYDALKIDYNTLEQEKEALNVELRELKGKLTDENAECNHSGKEEALFSESVNNASEQSKISPTGFSSEFESAHPNHDFFNNGSSEEYKRFKDRSSVSDSSGFLKEESISNARQLMISPASSSSIRYNCQSLASTSPMSWFQLSDARVISDKVFQHQFLRAEEQGIHSAEEYCNFLSVDQAPTLHWYHSSH